LEAVTPQPKMMGVMVLIYKTLRALTVFGFVVLQFER
jgi:hypothetical protein